MVVAIDWGEAEHSTLIFDKIKAARFRKRAAGTTCALSAPFPLEICTASGVC